MMYKKIADFFPIINCQGNTKKLIEISFKSVYHLSSTTRTEALSYLPHWSRANLVKAGLVMLGPHKTSASEQQPSSMNRSIYQVDLTVDMNEDQIQADPPKTDIDQNL